MNEPIEVRDLDDLDQAVNDWHRCRTGQANDVLVWPVGIYGQGMPQGIPFEVYSECPACGAVVNKWFIWKRQPLWTPS